MPRPDPTTSSIKVGYRTSAPGVYGNVRVSGLFFPTTSGSSREKNVVYFTLAECRDLKAWFDANLHDGSPGDQDSFLLGEGTG